MKYVQGIISKKLNIMVVTIVTLGCMGFLPNVTYALLETPTGFIYPSNSYWGGEYVGWLQYNSGNGLYHLGIDFKQNAGDPVYAIADGEVVAATTRYDGPDKGGALVVKHQLNDGSYFTALYGHITIWKQIGDQVKAGEQIGTIANCPTQWGNLPHLHFEIHPDPNVIWTPAYTPSKSDWKGCVDPLAFMNTYTPMSGEPLPLEFQGSIDDHFIGEGYQYVEQHRPDLLSQEPAYQYADIISWQYWDSFDIYGMDVSVKDNLMTVNINTNYTPGIVPGTDNITTTYGDLFISSNGWAPDSEVWEYVFDVDTGNLYDIHDAQDQILLSNDVYGEPFGVQTYRHGQEVVIDPRGLTAIGSGSAQKSGDYYSLTFDISNLNLVAGMTLGFHWTMGCANDVIEGAIQAGVPEPSTMLLLGSGILLIFCLTRNKKEPSTLLLGSGILGVGAIVRREHQK